MSEKDCGHHGHGSYYWGIRIRKPYRRFLCCLCVLLFIAGLAVLLVWLILRPTKPTFSLQYLSLLNLTLSTQPAAAAGYNMTVLFTTLQLTLSARNPNSHVGTYFDRLNSFASYRDQEITVPTSLPSAYLSSGDAVVWAPYISTPASGAVVAPSIAAALAQDETAGALLIHVETSGRLRWKVGTWVSGGYHLDVSCPALLSADSSTGGGGPTSLRFRQIAQCTVDI